MTADDRNSRTSRTAGDGLLDAAVSVTTRADGVVVCSIAGSLHQENEDRVRLALAGALERQPGLLAVDLSAVDLLTSAGLNALLTVRREAIERGVRLVLVAPSRPARNVLHITRVDTVLPSAPTLQQALREGDENPLAYEE